MFLYTVKIKERTSNFYQLRDRSLVFPLTLLICFVLKPTVNEHISHASWFWVYTSPPAASHRSYINLFVYVYDECNMQSLCYKLQKVLSQLTHSLIYAEMYATNSFLRRIYRVSNCCRKMSFIRYKNPKGYFNSIKGI